MKEGMISIIVPVYNIENYLSFCVESILAQTYKNYELLLIDDGSSDSSPVICDEYAKTDSRITVFHKQNEGPSATRNYGIEHSQGEFIVFVDSDDIIQPQMLEKMTVAMTKYQTDLCICGYERFKDDWRQRFRISPYSLVIFQSQQELASVYTKPETNMFGISIWGKMYRSDIILRENVRFETDIDYEEDCCFNIDYFHHITTTAVLRDYFYSYRQMEQSLSKGYRKNKFKFLISGYHKRYSFLEELDMIPQLTRIDIVFLVVIKMNLIKVYESSLTFKEKLEEYDVILSFPECQKICQNTPAAKSRLTRMLAKAVLSNDAKRIHMILTLWHSVVYTKHIVKKTIWRLKR